MSENRSHPSVEVREDPWKRMDCYVVDVVSELEHSSDAIDSVLQDIGFVLESYDLAGPIYIRGGYPFIVKIDERHRYEEVTPVILRQEPVAQQNIQDAVTQLQKLDSRIRLALEGASH